MPFPLSLAAGDGSAPRHGMDGPIKSAHDGVDLKLPLENGVAGRAPPLNFGHNSHKGMRMA
jgi:hypothetical protein